MRESRSPVSFLWATGGSRRTHRALYNGMD